MAPRLIRGNVTPPRLRLPRLRRKGFYKMSVFLPRAIAAALTQSEMVVEDARSCLGRSLTPFRARHLLLLYLH